MHNNKALTVSSTFVVTFMLLASGAMAQANTGEQLFQQHCSRCHQSPERIKTPVSQITPVLSSGNIRAHRFTLDEEIIRSIVEYIGQQ